MSTKRDDRHVTERLTYHGHISNEDDTNLAFSIDEDGDAHVEMNPNGLTEGTVRATYSRAQLSELCRWALPLLEGEAPSASGDGDSHRDLADEICGPEVAGSIYPPKEGA